MTLTLVSFEDVKDGIKQMLEDHMEKIEAKYRYAHIPEQVTPRQAAKILGVHYNTVMRWIQDGTIHAEAGKSGRIRIDKNEVIKQIK